MCTYAVLVKSLQQIPTWRLNLDPIRRAYKNVMLVIGSWGWLQGYVNLYEGFLRPKLCNQHKLTIYDDLGMGASHGTA